MAPEPTPNRPPIPRPIPPREAAVKTTAPRSIPLRRPGAVPAALETRDAAGGRAIRAVKFTTLSAADDGTVEGYGSVFMNLNWYDERIAAGAFRETLAAHRAEGTMPAMLWQHDPSEPVGVWTDMAEDDKGLRVKGRLVLETERGRAAHALLKAGALNGLSIGFVAQEWGYDRETEIRTVTKADLWEVSLVTFPADGKARVTSVRAADLPAVTTIRQAEAALREAGFSADAARAFVARFKRIVLDERDARDAAERATQAPDRLLRTFHTE